MTAPLSMRPRRADTTVHPIHVVARRIAEIRRQSLQLLMVLAGTIAAAHLVALVMLLVRP